MKKRIKGLLSILLFMVFGAGIGFFIAMFSDKYFSSISGAILLLMLIFGYVVHIIIHEGGHLVFGLLTGYSFVSFRVGSFIIITDGGKLELKKYNIPGTAGQCLMMPPPLNEGKFPFILYNYGGVIMNLIFSLIGILMVILIKGMPDFLRAIFILFSASGIFAALTNGIPMKIGGMPNDAFNIFSMLVSEEVKRGFYLQLKVNGLLSQGMRMKDMPLEMFKLKDSENLSNPLNTSVKLMEYNWHLDNMNFEEARKSIDSIVPYLHKLIPLYVNEINCERMFLELVGDCDRDLIDSLYNKDLKKYIKAAKFMISKKRLLMAYEGFYNEDKEKALEYYKEFNELKKNYPVKGDGEMEMMLVDWVKTRLDIND